MKHLFRNLAICLITLLFSLPAVSQQALSSIVKKGEIRIGMTGNQPPFTVKSKSGELIGYEVDLATALAKNMGVELKIVEMPFSELMPALKAGKVDAVMSGMTITPERNLTALFAGPYTLSGKTILTKTGKVAAFNADNAASTTKLKIIGLKGSTSEEFVKDNFAKHEIILVDDYNAGVQMILNNQADAMVADKPILAITILKNQGKDLVITDEPLTIEPIGMALPAGDAQFLNLVENYLESLEISGVLELLNKKWFQDGTWMLNVD